MNSDRRVSSQFQIGKALEATREILNLRVRTYTSTADPCGPGGAPLLALSGFRVWPAAHARKARALTGRETFPNRSLRSPENFHCRALPLSWPSCRPTSSLPERQEERAFKPPTRGSP